MGKIDRLAAERGLSTKEFLRETVEREGSVSAAARALKCFPNAIAQRMARYSLEVVEVRSVRVIEKT